MNGYAFIVERIQNDKKFAELMQLGSLIVSEVYNTAADNLVFHLNNSPDIKDLILKYREILKKGGLETRDTIEDFYNHIILPASTRRKEAKD